MNAQPALGRDLTDLARLGALDRVVGRDLELDEIVRVLCRRTKSNPLLLGEPGVGKTALVEGLAQKLLEPECPPLLRGRRLLELELGSLLAGTQFRGDLEKRLQDFVHEAKRDRSIVFIDEIHLLVLAGKGSGIDVANLLKPILARGEVPCIGATTTAESAEMFRADPAMERRFQVVTVDEPPPQMVRAILLTTKAALEKHHRVEIDESVIDAALEASVQSGGRRNPDRAIDILEDACARGQLDFSRQAGAGNSEEKSEATLAAERELADAAASLDLLRHVRAREALEKTTAERAQKNQGRNEIHRIITVAHLRR